MVKISESFISPVPRISKKPFLDESTH
jgi:hypothetical protein